MPKHQSKYGYPNPEHPTVCLSAEREQKLAGGCSCRGSRSPGSSRKEKEAKKGGSEVTLTGTKSHIFGRREYQAPSFERRALAALKEFLEPCNESQEPSTITTASDRNGHWIKQKQPSRKRPERRAYEALYMIRGCQVDFEAGHAGRCMTNRPAEIPSISTFWNSRRRFATGG